MGKINVLHAFGLIIIAIGFVGCPAPEAPTKQPTPAPPYGVVEKDRFGFNTPWMFGALNNTPSTTLQEMADAAKKLDMPIVRFPGGTIANSYHFNKPGYNGQQPGATENYIHPFTRTFAPQNNPLIKISFVLNITEHFQHILYKGTDEELITENLQAITYLLDHGFKIPMIEIGNELSLTPECFWRVGNNPLKPIETVDENTKILTEIKQTYINNQAYEEAHFKDGVDKYVTLIASYQARINSLFQSKGQPAPIYGVPIHTIRPNNQYYGDTRHFLRYWNTRVRDMLNIHALIPHLYLSWATGNSNQAISEAAGLIAEYRKFFVNRKFWFTEFNANPTLNGINNDDTQEQIDVLSKLIQMFRDNNGDYYFLHQFFIDTSGYPLLYKKVTTTSKPVNGITNTSGTIIPDPQYGKNLFYSPLFCWAALVRGADSTEYNQLKAEYGCK